MEPGEPGDASRHVARWRARSVTSEAERFAKAVVGRLLLSDPARITALLWSCAKLAAYACSVGYALTEGVLFSEPALERFIASGTGSLCPATRRTLRTNLRFVARHLDEHRSPKPLALARSRARAPYSQEEIGRFLALADAQPTEARRHRANGLICLAAGAGLTGIDLRAVRGQDVTAHLGGVIVRVRAGRPRAVPVLARFSERVRSAASYSGPDFIVGGIEPSRRNVTSRLIASLSGGADLCRLEISRLRATWLCEVAERIGLATFMAAAGITCSQHLGDVVATLAPAGDEDAMALLGGRL